MKKTISTSIARTLFYIEEDAYKELEAYLTSIRTHFASYPDSKEIIEDIESRIAEQFIEFTGGQSKIGDRIVSLEHVKKLVASMGSPSDFGDETYSKDENTPFEKEAKGQSSKKLYRDTENAVIGGVSSGLAAYFGIDPIIPRILFVISIFFGGGGIIIYLILWLIIPEAKTTTQKLEMRGDPVTLETVSNVVKKKVDEVKTHRGALRKIIEIPFEIIRTIAVFVITRIIPLFGRVIGALLSLAAGVASIALISLLLIATINPNLPLFEFPIVDIFSYGTYYLIVILSFFIITIPVLCIGALGSLLMGRRSSLIQTFGGMLVGFWMLAVISGIVIAITHADQFERLHEERIAYEEKTRTISLESFSALHAKDNVRVIVLPGTTTAVTLRGSETAIEGATIENSNGSLLIRKTSKEQFCIFCSHRPLYATITIPSLTSITAENGTVVTWDDASTTNLTLSALNASRVTFSGTVSSLLATVENGSRIETSGMSVDLRVNAENASRFLGENLDVETAIVEVKNGSHVDVNAEKILIAKASNGSRVNQFGKASTTSESTVRNGSKIESFPLLPESENGSAYNE